MGKEKISVKIAEFDVFFMRKNVKYLRLKINENGEINLSVPLRATFIDAQNFVLKNQNWIKKTIAKIKNLSSNNKILFKGREYELNLTPKAEFAAVYENSIVAPNSKALDEFFKQELKQIINEYIAKFSPHISRPINRVSIKKMRTRWGSCNAAKGYINFSLNLIAKRPEFIEYVVLHEMTHLIFPHHKRTFYEFIATLMPDFRARL